MLGKCRGGCGRRAVMDDGWCMYGPVFCGLRPSIAQREAPPAELHPVVVAPPIEPPSLIDRFLERWRRWRWWR